jgi:hypothetical protein
MSNTIPRLNSFITQAQKNKGAIRLSMKGLADELGTTTEWLRRVRNGAAMSPELKARIDNFLQKHNQ